MFRLPSSFVVSALAVLVLALPLSARAAIGESSSGPAGRTSPGSARSAGTGGTVLRTEGVGRVEPNTGTDEQVVTTMEATAETAIPAGMARFRFMVPLDISEAADGAKFLLICRITNVSYVRTGSFNRRRWRSETSNLGMYVEDVPVANGTYRGNMKVDVDLPLAKAYQADGYVCQLESRFTLPGSTLPTGSYACDETGIPERDVYAPKQGAQCVDIAHGPLPMLTE